MLAIPIVNVTNAHGRRHGLTFAYLVGMLGAVGIVVALYLEWAPLAFAGMFCFGGGTAANLQTRYAAVDLAEPERRGRQLSVIVWATTLGAVAGPSLSPLADDALRALGAPRYAGPFLGTVVGFSGAVDADDRPSVQGLSDLLMGCAGATAGIASGVVVELYGYPMLTLLAACTVIPVVVAMLRTRLSGRQRDDPTPDGHTRRVAERMIEASSSRVSREIKRGSSSDELEGE